MVIFRLLGLWLILLAIIAFAVDGTRSFAGNELQITPLGQHWYNIHPASLNTLQAAIERHVHPFLWDPVLFTVLQWPSWLILAVLGFGLYWLARKRRKSVSPYMN